MNPRRTSRPGLMIRRMRDRSMAVENADSVGTPDLVTAVNCPLNCAVDIDVNPGPQPESVLTSRVSAGPSVKFAL